MAKIFGMGSVVEIAGHNAKVVGLSKLGVTVKLPDGREVNVDKQQVEFALDVQRAQEKASA